MGDSFNLLTEKWIPVIRTDGAADKIGIREALERAEEICEIAEPSPLVAFSVHRLLMAIVHWLMPIPDAQAWQTLWLSGKFPANLEFALGQRAKGCFDLFDAERPFYQVPALPKDKRLSVGEIAPEVPRATNVNHFRHAYDISAVLCPACCAKGLVQLPAFCTVGGQGKAASVNDVPPLYLLPTGDNLFQTILLNLPIAPLTSGPADVPSWAEQAAASGSIGFLEGTTWQPRRTLLLPEPGSGRRCVLCGADSMLLVREIIFLRGRSRSDERARSWSDPQVPLRDAKGVKRPIVPPDALHYRRSAAGFWRTEARAVFVDCACAPPILAQLRYLARNGHIRDDAEFRIMAFALQSNKAKLFSANATTWWLHAAHMRAPAARDRISTLLDLAETAAWAVSGDDVMIDDFENTVQREFTCVAARVAGTAEIEKLIEDWRAFLLREAAGFHGLPCLPPGSPQRFLKGTQAHNAFEGRLRMALWKGGGM